MPRTIKNTLRLTFDQGVKQSTYVRKLGPGDLTSLKNVRRPEDGPPEKRPGYDRETTSSFVGAAYQGPAAALVPSDVAMWRDSGDQVWNRQGSTGFYRGTDRGQVVPRYQSLENQANEGRAHKPLHVLRNGGTEIWEFSMGVAEGFVSGYQVTVLDAATRQPLRETTRVGADGIVSWAAVVDADDTVWLFYTRSAVGARHVVMAHKWTSYDAFGTETTYADLTGFKLESIDAWLLEDSGEVVVAATSFDGDTSPDTSVAWWSYLDAATGSAKVSPAPGSETNVDGGVEDPKGCNGISILKSDGSDGFFYLAYCRPGSGPDGVSWRRIRVNATTLAADDSSELQFIETGTNAALIGLAGGYLDGTSEVWATTVLRAYADNDLNVDLNGGGTNVSSAVTYQHVHDGTTTTTVLARAAYLAAKPLQVEGAWYWLTGFQDAEGAQRSYWWRDADGNLIVPMLDGEAATVLHAGGLAGGFGGQDYTYAGYSGHVVDGAVLASGDVVYPLLRDGLTALSPDPVVATLNRDETFRSTARGILPGGIPKRVSPHDRVTELSPLQFPAEPLSIQGNGGEVTEHSENVVAYRYLTKAADGKIYVSSPSAVQTLTFLDYASPDTTYVVRLPTLRHVIGQTFIGLYGSANGATNPFLQRVIPNDPDEDYIDLDVAPASWADTGETLETLGGALDQAPAPPCRIAFVHKDRLVLAGTPDDTIWPSQEFEEGRGPEFNEALAFSWGDGTGEVTAGCSLNEDAYVLFREDAIGVVAGPGPDGNAQNGAYSVATIPAQLGTTNPASVVQGPAGVYFKAAQDRRFYVTSGGVPIDVSAGIEDYLNETVTAAVHDTAARVVRFYCASGKKLILDAARPLPDQPFGQWYVDEGAGLRPAVGAAMIGGEPVALEAGDETSATTFKPGSGYTDDGEEILVDYVMGPLAPAGPLGEFDVLKAQLSSTHLGGDSVFNYVLTNAQGTPETHEDVANEEADVAFTVGFDRTREVYLRITETSATGRGRRFDGVALVVGVYARGLQNPRRRIS